MLSERQQLAASLASELYKLGAWVTNAMPLRSEDSLKFQVRDIDRDQVIAKLRAWDWNPTPCGVLPRITHSGLEQASVFQLDLPPERQPIPTVDRAIIRDAKAEKRADEVIAMLKACGWRK
jgi:hypothetical protein